MSLFRSLSPMTSCSSVFFKALATVCTSSSCPHTSRLLSTSRRHYQSSKRDLYTAPAYRPYGLPESVPPPPRNAGAADTSIAGPTTLEVNDTRRPQSLGQSDEVASIALPEYEAQKSRPIEHFQRQPDPPKTTAPPALKTSDDSDKEKKQPPQRKGKLKPRKAAISITAPALSHLRDLVSEPSPKMIRVGVKNRGCSGLAYHLEYVDRASAFDEVVEQDGVKVLVDSKALFSIIGSEMDWQEDKLSTRFVFRNPNIKEQCGCGESFMV